MAVDYANGWASRNAKVMNGKIEQEVRVFSYPGGGIEDATVFSFTENVFNESQSYSERLLKVYGYDAWLAWEATGYDPALEPEFDELTPAWEPV